jgi:hypothetical protein
MDFEEGDPSEPIEHTEEEPLISLHAIAGVRTDDIMQVRVQVGEKECTALIDTGSTHNFFSTQAAQAVELQIEANTGTKVVVANGDRVPCSGPARDVEIKVGQDIFTINAYSIPLDCFDMVLGVSFLKPLHTVLLDFDDLVMAFTYNGRVLWKGLGSHRCDIPPLLAYIPSGNRRTLFLITSCTHSTMSSKNQKGSHPLEIVTNEFI